MKKLRSSVYHWFIITTAVLMCPFTTLAQEFSKTIEDNSYFIEEAYNQESRVVQHISTGSYQRDPKVFMFSFTQEWPVGGQRHQLSYTIPYQSSPVVASGFGDIVLNYRYQLWGEEHWVWIAPRLSIIVPTGETSEGLGNGVLGFQMNLPFSKRWTDGFVSHVNIGATVLPGVAGTGNDGREVHHTLTSLWFGASGIWLLSGNLNLMGEVLHSINAAIGDAGQVIHTSQTIPSPGVRVAIDLDDLQIVPGVALPIVFSGGRSDAQAFFYLSFEHPF